MIFQKSRHSLHLSKMINTSNFHVPDWAKPSSVKALVTTRSGGVSLPPYDQLNLGLNSGDNLDTVMKNRQIVRQSLPGEPVWLKQVHGISVSTPTTRLVNQAGPYEADASVTNQVNEVLAILTADCMPILFASDHGDVIGAAHAGWRGLSQGVLERTIDAMCLLRPGLEPSAISAWMGPAIGPNAFEVGEDVYEAFSDHDSSRKPSAFTPISGKAGKYFANLYILAEQRMRATGLSKIQGGGFCTYQDNVNFYSYRRDGITGRFASLIWISPVR